MRHANYPKTSTNANAYLERLSPEARALIDGAPLDRPIRLTTFPTKAAQSKREVSLSVSQLATMIRNTEADDKTRLPWLKGAIFGNRRTLLRPDPTEPGKMTGNSLRHDANVNAVTAVELDYDAEVISPEEARDRLRRAGVTSLVYTTPSHTPEAPRWRILAPCSAELSPDRRAALVARLNGLFDGEVDGASFTLSQAYYFGNVKGGARVSTFPVEGHRYIDEAVDLDATAVSKRQRPHGNAHSPSDRAFDEVGLLADIVSGANYHGSAMSLIGHWAAAGAGYLECRERIYDAFLSIPEDERRDVWSDRVASIPEMLAYVFGRKFAETHESRDHLLKLFDAIEPEGGYPVEDLPATVLDDDFGAPMMRGDKPVLNMNNAMLYLGRNLGSILPDLRRNQMTGRDEWRGGPVDDEALTLARVKLERLGLVTITKELVADAVAAVARYNSYHPIRDELARIQHDGIARLDTWLIRFAGAEDTPYVRAVGRKFLIQMVARVMQPGCKADHVLVLSGPQGAGKSTLCRILAGDYFSDNLPAINGGKDTMIHLRGKWLIELSEMAPSHKSEAEDLKAFLTATVDSYREPYGRTESAWPRQCVFVGTTNNDEFLNDDTGGRRFWIVTIRGVIDTEALSAEREQLFAEALAAFNDGEPWHLSREFEALHAKPIQDAARFTDTWAEIVAEYLERPIQDNDQPARKSPEVTLRDVLYRALGILPERQSPSVQRRAAAVMRGLGWRKIKTMGRMVWRRPEE